MTDSRETAQRFVERAIESKKDMNYEEAAKYNLHALKIYKKLGDDWNRKLNLANYHSLKGKIHLKLEKSNKARNHFVKAEKLFRDLNFIRASFYCRYDFIMSYRTDSMPPYNQYFQILNSYIDDYIDDLKDDPSYLKSVTVPLIEESKRQKDKGNYECSAQINLQMSELYNRIGDDRNNKICLANYFGLKGLDLSFLEEFTKARESFLNAGDSFFELDIIDSAIY
jgi:hypothetical protein